MALDKVIVIRDSDCAEPQRLEEGLRQDFVRSGVDPYFSVCFYATRCELESLLLADENAINVVAQERGHGFEIGRVNYECQGLVDAKELFQKKLTEVGLPVTQKVYAKVASAASPEIIGQRCPYFLEIRNRLQGD